MEKIEKKEISEKAAVKAIITGFVCYSLLIGFICLLIAIIVTYFVNKATFSNELLAKAAITFISAIFIYAFIHFICRLSNIDLFKKCRFDRNKESFVCKKLNLFYLLCIIFFVILTISSLYIRFENQLALINYNFAERANDMAGTDIAYEYAESYKQQDLNNFYENRTSTLLVAIIIELSLVYSFISLIPYQKKLLSTYNTDKNVA